MLNWPAIFMGYVILSGLYLYSVIHRPDFDTLLNEIENLDEKTKEEWEDLQSQWYVLFNNKNILPVIDIICLLFGWVILPMCLFSSISKMFKN